MCQCAHYTHNYPFIFRQLETDCSTNYLIKDPPTKVGKKRKFSVTATLLLCVTAVTKFANLDMGIQLVAVVVCIDSEASQIEV